MMMTRIKTLRPTYAYIDLDNYAHNVRQAQALSGCEIMAIVKANGYGHGAQQVAEHAFQVCGVHKFGVATIKEGIALRENMGEAPEIQVLGYVDKNFYPDVVDKRLILTIFDQAIADSYHQYLNENGLTANVVLKIDTGMNRLGFDDTLDFHQFLNDHPCFDVKMLMSHMPSSDSELIFSEGQIQRFQSYITQYQVDIPTSLYNSAGICNYSAKFDCSRPGLMIYGYVYSEKPVDLKPVMKIFSKITHIKQVKKGESISYNRTFTAEEDMTIGVVPIGYADGYPRKFSNVARMHLCGYDCPVVGTVCMDMTMVDLTHVPSSAYTEVVEIMGEHITAEDWAKWSDTISYEVLCGISERIPRVYP